MRIITRIIILTCILGMLTGCKANKVRSNTVSENEQANTQANEQAEPRPKSEVAKINVQLGMAYLEQKNVQRAKQKFLLAMQQGPDIPETWYSMAYFLEATGNKEEARKYYLKSVEIAPARGDVQNNYGTFLCRSGQHQESMKHFMMAAKDPDYLDPAAAFENAGLCSMKMHAYQQAAGYFRQALLKDPARSFSLLNLAEADMKLGNYEHAQEMLTQYSVTATTPAPEYKKLSEQLAKH